MRDLAKSQSRLPMSAPPHQPRARSSGPRCRRCLPHPPAPAATAGRPFGSARRLHPRDVAVAERLLSAQRPLRLPVHPPTATLEPALRGAVAAERDAQARAGAASPDATAWPSSEQCVPQCPSGPSCSCLYWARYADIRVYTEVGGLLEVWEPLAPRWAPRMHVRTNIMKSGRF